MLSNPKNKHLFPLIVMASLFFLFGFITTMNNSMIDFLKDAFKLNEIQKQLPNTFFYGAYIFSVPVGFLIHRIGYKKGVLSGLALIVLGLILCIPGVSMGYYGFLSAVSIFAIGVVLLQVAANPYVNALGKQETAASRLTLTNALNSVATVVAPIFVSLLIVTSSNDPKAVQVPFGIIAGITLLILTVMLFLKLPEIKADEKEIKNGETKTYKSHVFKNTHLWLGSLAIFFYMGIEVGIPSFFADFSNKTLGFNFHSLQRTNMLKYYWGGLMLGRLIGIFLLCKYTARHLLTYCALGGAALLFTSIFIGANASTIALWAFLGTGLFHSIMWPTIYNLSLEDLGPQAKIGSGVIATSVIGAAILTPMIGVIQQFTGLTVAISCLFVFYGYLIFFASKGSKIRN